MHTPDMRIAIVGAGAIGCRIAAHLAQRGTTTTLFDAWPEHVRALSSLGLAFERDGVVQHWPVRAFAADAPPDETFDLVLLAVRSDATAAMLPLVRRLLAADGCVVSCQNGINEGAIAQAVGAQRTLGCSMVMGARLTGPGQVRVLEGADTLRIGELDGSRSERVIRLAELLSACGTATVTQNLLGYRWMKLVLNATGNPLLLLSGQTAASLHESAEVRRAIIALAGEILATATGAGIEVEPVLGAPTRQWLAPYAGEDTELHARLLAHGEALGPRRLSMTADFEARGRTEVEHINGYVVAEAIAQGRAAPLNAWVLQAVKALEAGTVGQGWETLDPLLALYRSLSSTRRA
ncbi:2-dehydropantoate 2-reductase [Verticiella sediminum]|uniref:2-dehydropantoate 2-reductase n=1 Tax=Verticiella sediminum TaxID=1247510 RepID=A0A556B1F2_9BURK|nr:2-dehydropantoate 2-reductase [Verticiella sediminum]TSH99000.1 2-dehydropantoate 2-reductase [Verticiella sediminum]